MRSILIMILLLSSVIGRAQTVPCQKNAEELVKSLEGVLVDLEGFAQGDFEEYQLDVKVKKQTSDKVTLTVDSYHTNEDQEDWVQQYEVTYNVYENSCFIDTYSFLGYSSEEETPEPTTCVDEATAKQALEKSFKGLYNTVPVDDFSWLSEDKEENVVTTELVNKAVTSLHWDKDNNQYFTEVLFRAECAASVECSSGYSVDCNGDVYPWTEADE